MDRDTEIINATSLSITFITLSPKPNQNKDDVKSQSEKNPSKQSKERRVFMFQNASFSHHFISIRVSRPGHAICLTLWNI